MPSHDNIADATSAKRDNLIGICHALGEDLGFNPDYLRVALGVLLLLNAELALAVYGGLGLLVIVSRQVIRRFVPPAKVAATKASTTVDDVAAPASEFALAA